jgi:hypothetical protein
VAPTGAAWRVVGARRVDPRWQPFLGEGPWAETEAWEAGLEEPA